LKPDPRLAEIRSDIAGIEWPPISIGAKAMLHALLLGLDRTQWAPPEEIAAQQRRQLAVLARHLAANSEWFGERLRSAGLVPNDLAAPGGLARLPPLRRRDIQLAGERFFCREIPARHQPTVTVRTSGSTGEPVTLRRTAVNKLFWTAFTFRDHLWHGRDFAKRISSVRARIDEPTLGANWGVPLSLFFRSGPSQYLPAAVETKQLYTWLAGFRPGTLLTHPSTLDLLARYCQANDVRLKGLAHIWTTGETLPPETRALSKTVFGIAPADLYSSEEVGVIAIQCPETGLYHVMAESLIVEVLDESGRPCRDGEIGRVVVTDLHNFATPLLRYDLGDVAEAAGQCSCGRGLPTLRRVLGRARNLMVMPNGERVWPHLGTQRFREIAAILQYQFIQHDREAIEARFVAATPLTQDQEERMRKLLQNALGHPFAIRFTYFDNEIPRGPGGKFEQFICKVA
jgi:phenylacetate-CoA ligase